MIRSFWSFTESTVSRPELVVAAAANDLKPLQDFILSGGPLERVRNDTRGTLLHVAAFEGSSDALALLLREVELVKLIDCRDRSKRTALHFAAATGSPECVRRLAAAGAAVNLQDEWGCTPLHLAVKFENPDSARELLEMGADASVLDKARTAARAYALGSQEPAMVALFRELQEAELVCSRPDSRGGIDKARPADPVASNVVDAFGRDATVYGFTSVEAESLLRKSDPAVGEAVAPSMGSSRGLGSHSLSGSPTPLVVGRPLPFEHGAAGLPGVSDSTCNQVSTGKAVLAGTVFGATLCGVDSDES